MRPVVRAISRLFPRTHPLHESVVWIYDHSRLAWLAEFARARGRVNAVFLHIPKTAGTSINVALDMPVLNSLELIRYRFTGRGLVSFGHMDYAALVRDGIVSHEFDSTAVKFAFCRNPYDRAVSLWSYLRQIGKLPADCDFLAFCRQLRAAGCPPIGAYNVSGLSQCNPQVRWIERVAVDFLGRFESLDELDGLARRLRQPAIRLLHENPSSRRRSRDHYCDESRSIVEEFYAEDFKRFDYPRTLP